MSHVIRAFSPGSVGNIGVGFDIIGHSIAGIGDTGLHARLDPAADRCCVRLTPVDEQQIT